LQEHPDIEARVGFDDQVEGHAGMVMVVAQTETANHECETKARQGCRSRARPGQDYRTANTTCMTRSIERRKKKEDRNRKGVV
jgi:hypothetical protein